VSLDVLMDRMAGKSAAPGGAPKVCTFFFFFTLVTGARRSLSLKLSDTRVYEGALRSRGVATRIRSGPLEGELKVMMLLGRIFRSEHLGGENLRTPPHSPPCCPSSSLLLSSLELSDTKVYAP